MSLRTIGSSTVTTKICVRPNANIRAKDFLSGNRIFNSLTNNHIHDEEFIIYTYDQTRRKRGNPIFYQSYSVLDVVFITGCRLYGVSLPDWIVKKSMALIAEREENAFVEEVEEEEEIDLDTLGGREVPGGRDERG